MKIENILEKKITKIVKENLILKREFKKNTDLISNGLLDSVNIFLLINELEKNFKIKIAIKNFDIKNFKSVKNIKNYLSKRKRNNR